MDGLRTRFPTKPQARMACATLWENTYSCNGLYIYRVKFPGTRTVAVRVRERGVEIEDSTYGKICESNYQVFKALYPPLAAFFWRKTKWVKN